MLVQELKKYSSKFNNRYYCQFKIPNYRNSFRNWKQTNKFQISRNDFVLIKAIG